MTHVCRSRYKAPWYPAITPAHSRCGERAIHVKATFGRQCPSNHSPYFRYTDNAPRSSVAAPSSCDRWPKWLVEQEPEEVVMESTVQYWKPLWEELERYWKPLSERREGPRRKSGTLHLAQALSNRGRQGRKRDFPDAERLVKRLVPRGINLELCARPRATSMADGYAEEEPSTTISNTPSESIGVLYGRGTYQVVYSCLRFVRP